MSLKKQIYISLIFFIFYLLLSFIKEPWHDEIYTNFLVKKQLFEIFKELKKDSGPPFYYIFLHIFCYPFKYSFFALRFFSALFIFASGIFLLKLVNNFKYWFLFYTFPISLYYSAEARNYSFIIFFSFLLFYEIYNKKRLLPITVYLFLLLLTHNLSIFFLTYLLFFFIFQKEKNFLYSLLLSIFLYIPIFLFIINQPKESIYWIGKDLKINEFFSFFSNLGPNLFKNNVYSIFPVFPFWIFSLLNLFIIIFSFKERKLMPVAISFFINMLLIFLFSLKIINIYISSRSEVFFYVPFLIFLFNFLNKKTIFSKILTLIYFITSLISSIFILISFSKPLIFREEISKILKFLKPDTNLCVIGPIYLTTKYALEIEGYKNNLILFPPSQMEHPGWYFYPKLIEKDKKWFLDNVLRKEKSFIIIWIKGDPIAEKLKGFFPKDGILKSYGRFEFFLKY